MKSYKLLNSLPALVIKQFFISKAPFFMSGLIISYNFMENWLDSTMMDHFTESLKSERNGAIITNMQDGLSCIFVVIAYLISEAYTGSFTAITFCTTASIMGSMMFWISITTPIYPSFEYYMIYVAIILMTLGKTAGKCLFSEFFEFQLKEKVRAKKKELEQKGTYNARLDHVFSWTTKLWDFYISTFSFAIVFVFSIVIVDAPWQGVRFVSLFMLGSYLLFYFGYAWYNHEDFHGKSNVGKFCRVCKTAYRKRNLAYLTSGDGYYWKNCKEGHLYEDKHGHGRVVRLLPRVPRVFGWLDKAAIIDEEHTEDHDVQETKGELCTVKQVREAKSIVVLLCWGFSFFAYSFVAASGNSFFVSQATHLESFTDNDISLLFLLQSFTRDMATPAFFWLVKKAKIANKINRIFIINFGAKRKVIDSTAMKICIGMFIAAICCVFAWKVENHRLHLTGIMMSSKAMIPQFLLLGMAEALVEDGLSELFQNYASESVRNSAEPFSNLVTGIGKLLSIPWFLIFNGWVNESNNTASRHLDRYFLMLAILNLVFLLFFLIYYYIFVHNNEFPNDEDEEAAGNGVEQNLATSQEPGVPEEDKEIEMEQILEHDHEIDSSEEHSTMFFESDSNHL